MDNTVRVLSTLALKGAVHALPDVLRRQAAAHRCRFRADAGAAGRLRGGEGADVVILTREGLDELAREGRVVRRAAWIWRVVCRHRGEGGRRHPDIATEPALRATLLGARSVAYSRIGASGILFAQLIERLGIAAEINARAVIIPQGFTAELVTGEADLAVQQISELKQVAGIEVVGPIPRELQTPAVFSAGRWRHRPMSHSPTGCCDFSASPEVAPVLRETGLEP